MNHLFRVQQKFDAFFSPLFILLIFFMNAASPKAFCQETDGTRLEKMPADLETTYALSALPPHLRKAATVYALDPAKGYDVVQKGTNGFICFITRTEWEWGEFRKDLTMPISFDAEGAWTIFPVYRDVAAMRASGKFTAKQIKYLVLDRIRKGVYKAPARAGVSYMLAPVMRGYNGNPNNNQITTMSMPHYMFYAPYLNNTDVGGNQQGPFVLNQGSFLLGDRKGPHGYMIMPAGEMEAAKIVSANSDLVKRLIAYKAYYKVNAMAGHH
ncbi:hypothetical protein [Mucilaginibacter agri]|uniref:Uncharacterized protein n=1 Tax=Mucilaginibacter agri TaxID=2695265 RepID=A0A965ZK21_9SPHI|nr:hypothetical protein [Mucilaginibacter agri]NCD71132.1 hypothetical protein [Mucilaginibacter agri]